MIDEQKRKLIIYAIVAFGSIVVIGTISFFLLRGGSDLPPVEDTETQSQNEDQVSESTPETTVERVTLTKDGVTFHGFEQLQRFAITDSRIEVILYNMATYANRQPGGVVSEFTLDEASLQETTEGERRVYTFNTKGNNDKTFKIELSYVYSADAYVRVFDDSGAVVQSSY